MTAKAFVTEIIKKGKPIKKTPNHESLIYGSTFLTTSIS